jgi:hypothetical protein
MEEQYLIFIGILAPLITGVTQAIKKSIPGFPTNLAPLLSVVVGIGLAFAAWVFTDLDTAERLWCGLIAGLAASGLYNAGKLTAKTFTKPKI